MSTVIERKGNFLSDIAENRMYDCVDVNRINKMSPEEYTSNIFNYWDDKSNGELAPWLFRLNDSRLTTNDFTIDDVNKLLNTTDYIKDVLHGKQFVHIGKLKQDRLHKLPGLGLYQPGMVEERFDNTESIWMEPEGVYLLKCTYNDISYWIKIGKASLGIHKRIESYRALGKYVHNATLTEIHLCELLRAGVSVDIYGLTCPITKPVLAGHNVIRPNNVISSDNLEDWLRSELISIYGKKFVE
jgi:hypothetical protein